MLQLNHISVKGINGYILKDCTYRFNEGEIYVLYMKNKKDIKIFFDCLSNYRKPEEGEVTTWTDATIYNISSRNDLPSDFTVGEFLYSLSKINGAEYNLEAALENVPQIREKSDIRIKDLSEEELKLLHTVTFMTVKSYINLWGVPFAPDEYMEKLTDVVGEFKVYIFASDDINECNRIAELFSVGLITCVDGGISEYKKNNNQ